MVTAQRDLFGSVSAGSEDLPGVTAEDERYFRDVYDHLIRISDLLDTYRDLLSSAMDVYLSSVSNRLNAVMKQLAMIATVFLPLSFIVGFFGQNFAYMVRNVTSARDFWLYGIGTEVVAIVALLYLFDGGAGSSRQRLGCCLGSTTLIGAGAGSRGACAAGAFSHGMTSRCLKSALAFFPMSAAHGCCRARPARSVLISG